MIERRLAAAAHDVAHADAFDYIIVNDDFDHALQDLVAITRSIRLETARQTQRCVGLANGANPLSIVVPCHRIVGSDGSLTGFASGLPRKAASTKTYSPRNISCVVEGVS